MFTIGEIAKRAGVGIEAVRHYEKIGLMPPPPRTAGNYRLYDASHLERLRRIRRARDLGFPLDRVRELLDLAVHRESSCEAVDVIARRRLADVDGKIADLTALRDELVELIEGCGRGAVADCLILRALSPRGE